MTLVVASLLCAAQPLNWLDGLEAKLLDLRFAIRGERSPSDAVAVITIQDHTLLEHPTLPSNPALHATLIDRLTGAGAAAIVLDLPGLARRVAGGGEQATSSDHQDLTSAIYESGRVVLPMTLVPAPDTSVTELPAPVRRFSAGKGKLTRPVALAKARVMYPLPAMCAVTEGMGMLNVYPDRDGTLREAAVLFSVGGELYPALALEAVRVALGERSEAYVYDGKGSVTVGDARIPLSPTGETVINFAGPANRYAPQPYERIVAGDALDPKLAEMFDGRIVLVGVTATSAGTHLATPFTPYMDGVEAVANVIDTLLTKRFIRRPDLPVALILTVMAALLTMLAVRRLTASRAAAVVGVAILALGAAATGLFAVGVWLPIAGPVLSILAVGGWFGLSKAASEYVERRQTTDRIVARVDALAGMGRLFNSGLNREQLLTEIMKWVEEEVGCEAASLILLADDDETLVFEVALGPKGDELKGMAMRVGEGIVGDVVATGKTLLVPDTTQDPRFAHDVATAVGFPARSILCVPMSIHGRVVGAIEVIDKRDDSLFTDQDAALLTVIAQHAAMFLETARLYGVLEQRVDLANRELRVANQRLGTEKAKLETIVEHMADGIIAADESGRIVLLNPVAEKILRGDAGPLVGTAAADLDHRELAEMFAEGPDVPESVREFTIGDPVERIIRARSAVAADEEGVAGRVVVLTDITDLRELDRTKTDMVSFVSHELKNPLASIRGFAGLIRDRSGDEAHREHASFISRQAERMFRLIDDFLNIARIDMGGELEMHWEWIDDIGPAIGEAIDTETRGDLTHEFRAEISPDMPPFRADPDKLHQILVNLVNNAVKYSPDGGEIVVTATASDGSVHIAVCDHGIGISDENMGQLFQRFRRVRDGTTDRVEGTGLGLFLIRQLVQAHGGEIWAESVPEVGSTFHVSLPIEGKADDEQNSDAQLG